MYVLQMQNTTKTILSLKAHLMKMEISSHTCFVIFRKPTDEAELKGLLGFIQLLWPSIKENQLGPQDNQSEVTDANMNTLYPSDVHGYLPKVISRVKVHIPEKKFIKYPVPDNIKCEMCHKIIKARPCSMFKYLFGT